LTIILCTFPLLSSEFFFPPFLIRDKSFFFSTDVVLLGCAVFEKSSPFVENLQPPADIRVPLFSSILFLSCMNFGDVTP